MKNEPTVEERIQMLTNIRTWTLSPEMDDDEFKEVWDSEGDDCSVDINYSPNNGWIVYLTQGPGYSRTANVLNKKLDELPLPDGYQLLGYGKNNFEVCVQGNTLEEALDKLEGLIDGLKKYRSYKIVFWED